MTESTEIQQAEPSHSVALEEVYDQLAKEATDAATEETETVETEEQVETEESEVNAEVDAQEEVEEDIEEVELEAPKDWNKAEIEAFDKLADLDPDATLVLQDRYNNLHKGFHDKSQALAEITRENEAYDKIFEPHEQRLAMHGKTRTQAIQTYMAWEQAIINNPREAIKQLAEANNVDLTLEEEDDYSDPAVKKLEAKIRDLEQSQSNGVKASKEAENNQLIKQANEFATETDKDGNSLHPHVNNPAITAIMSDLIIKNGYSMEKAYSMAVTSEGLTGEDIQQKRRRVAKAKKAGSGLPRSSTTRKSVSPKVNKSQMDELSDVYDSLAAST